MQLLSIQDRDVIRGSAMVKKNRKKGKKGSVVRKGTFEKTKKSLLIIVGTISLGLGIIGIVLPLLPTTPFLLLASYCYCRGSKRLDNWLLNNRYLGEYIRNYREGKGISLTIKVFTISLLWAVISYSAFFIMKILIVQVILVIIAIGVSIHLIEIPTYKRKKGPR